MSSANNSQFVQTRKMFREYLSGYPKNLTFEDWKNADSEDQAALLYLTFYQEVTLAWYNAVVAKNVVYVSQEDGVSTVLQYLMKNVNIIIEDAERYSPKYIYRVCFNCLLSLWQTRGTDQRRSEVECSNELAESCYSGHGKTRHGGNLLVDIYDLIPSNDEDYETQQVCDAIENIIKHMGPKAEKVVNHLINPKDTLHKVSKSSPERPGDRLADISVSKAEYEAIIAELREKLAPYKDAVLLS